MSEKPFSGHIAAMRADADWLGAEDLIGLGDVPYQIERIAFDNDLKIAGRASKDKHYLYLLDANGKKSQKKLLINSHRRKMLGKIHGPTADKWAGQWIWLFVDEVKAVDGGRTLGVRMRDRRDPPKAQQAKPEPPKETPPPAELSEADESRLLNLQVTLDTIETRSELDAKWKELKPNEQELMRNAFNAARVRIGKKVTA